MAILQAVLAMVFRSAGKILNTVFGWATVLLFGKVPEDRQYLLSAIALGSVLWLAVALGIAFPSVGTFLLAFVPLPKWMDDNWVRIIMLGLTVTIPLAVGGIALYLTDPAERPTGWGGRLKAILKGYPYTVGLALTLVMMVLAAPILKVRDLVRRWTSTHIPIVVEGENYLAVVSDVQRVLREGEFETHREPASWLLRWPTKVFTLFAGGAVENLVADELTVLKSPKIEVLLHPSDLVVHGREEDVMRAHALITEHLTFTKAYQTWSKEAQQLEDKLLAIWKEVDAAHTLYPLGRGYDQLQEVEEEMKTIRIPYEQWEVLFREKLTVERALLRQAVGLSDTVK
jgi:hypothetical protein